MRQLAPIEGCSDCTLGRANPCPFHETRLAAGSVLIAQGEKPDRVWLLRRGTVLVSTVSGTGEETQCALRGPGSLIGLEALRDDAAGYQAWTLSDAVVCGLSSERFRSWVGPRDNPLGVVLDLALDEVAERGEERIALAGRTVERVARFLVARRRLEKRDRPLRIQHQLLARMLGMRAETLSPRPRQAARRRRHHRWHRRAHRRLGQAGRAGRRDRRRRAALGRARSRRVARFSEPIAPRRAHNRGTRQGETPCAGR